MNKIECLEKANHLICSLCTKAEMAYLTIVASGKSKVTASSYQTLTIWWFILALILVS